MSEELLATTTPEAPEAVAADAGTKKKRTGRKTVTKGRMTIQCTFNNTIITAADSMGNTLGWASSGHLGFKGAKKSTPYAATQIVASLAEKVKKFGLTEVDITIKGVGNGREAAVRALANNGFTILSLRDVTPLAHNGCRPRRPRRI